ncbi:GNAT family N-acetyltransferase [Pseudalkalibacillus sp. SCS-8]|uniref:GNAT family N-acetyltransferase n=1 Tax=Pseudalkalibacillus nanhaiensis TaxID=3115291 RepID=UPI0032DA2A8E
MITIERLSNCTLTDVLEAWNSGFKGYFTDMTMTMDYFLQRMVQEGFSAEDSIVAFVSGVPAGIVLNGFRSKQGKLIGYNGGTGVAPEFRRTGVGKRMMEAVLDIYRDKGVDTATLEAIHSNDAAIALYRSLGYQVTDRVEFLQQNGVMEGLQSVPDTGSWSFVRKDRETIQQLPFYDDGAPWQTQWQSVHNGEVLIALSDGGKAVGYALYRRVFKENTVSTIILHQYGISPLTENPDELRSALLAKVFAPELSCKRIVINLSKQKLADYEAVRRLGFETMIEQVCMEKNMRESMKVNATCVEEI